MKFEYIVGLGIIAPGVIALILNELDEFVSRLIENIKYNRSKKNDKR